VATIGLTDGDGKCSEAIPKRHKAVPRGLPLEASTLANISLQF
jgi:hypothetical protein